MQDDSWYEDVEAVTSDTTLETISKLHQLVVHIKDAIQESNNFELTRQVAAKIEKKAKILEQNAFFVREGSPSSRHLHSLAIDIIHDQVTSPRGTARVDWLCIDSSCFQIT